MRVFHYVVNQYADDHFVHDLTQDVQHVDDQSMDGQMICVLGGQSLGVLHDQSLGVLHDQCVVPMRVTYRLLALVNENVRKLELQRCHQLVSQRAAWKLLIRHNALHVTSNALGCELLS
jgi:hypothetical protein